MHSCALAAGHRGPEHADGGVQVDLHGGLASGIENLAGLDVSDGGGLGGGGRVGGGGGDMM